MPCLLAEALVVDGGDLEVQKRVGWLEWPAAKWKASSFSVFRWWSFCCSGVGCEGVVDDD